MRFYMNRLRTGVTTGICAAAAAKAAAVVLLSSVPVARVEVTAKNGATLSFDVTDTIRENGAVICAVQKDAGDDPDVTDGIKIFAAVSKTDAAGIGVDGGEGVGRVTKPGLKVPVGFAAINPVPMEMIKTAIASVCESFSYAGGVKVVISVPGGADIAKKTMNGRLGIVGGLSILGTTGIVEPMSSRAVVETIKTEIDVRTASGIKNLLITPGNYGRAFASSALGLDIENAVKCSNFFGETLDYACARGVENITLIGHAGKLVKLAGGIMNTHSGVADCRMEIIAAHSALAGAGTETIRQIMGCATTEAAIGILMPLGINGAVWDSIGGKIGFHLRERVKGSVFIEYIVFTQEHGVLIHSATDRNDA
jgi:cobalt-precorrin-5B (C1)-methyltransferase